MKVLVIGSGGREHSLAWKLSQSPEVKKIFIAPGNGGTELVGENVDIKANDLEGLLSFAKKEAIDLTVVGPEDPLVEGLADRFRQEGLRVFGVGKEGARLEGSKIFSKEFMERHGVPTAKYRVYRDYDRAKREIEEFSLPIVIKADGLCAGKGVVICNSYDEALDSLDSFLNDGVFGEAGKSLIIEEFLEGVEASLLCFVSGGRIIPMESAKDYKKIYNDDQGPNTGGVGCFSPSPLFTEELKKRIRQEVLNPIEKGFKEDSIDFNGILFIGFMIDKDIKVLEFNVRFGDPETEVVLPRLKSDLFKIFNKCIDNELGQEDLDWEEDGSLALILTSKGYPGHYEKGLPITIGDLDKDIVVFHNGTLRRDDKLYTNGGRVLTLMLMGKDRQNLRSRIYQEVEKVDFENIYYRDDIGR